MPSLNDSRKTITVDIPSIPGGKATLWQDLTVGDSERVEGLSTDIEKGIATLHALIQSWNLDEECTVENLKKLPSGDFEALLLATDLGKRTLKSLEDVREEGRQKKTA